jgi:hypothetical protein
MVRLHPALFHASLYGAAVHLDLLHSSIYFSNTVEIMMHKFEAIRLINEELSRNRDIPEAIILAIVSLIREARKTVKSDNYGNQLKENRYLPFKLVLLPMQW